MARALIVGAVVVALAAIGAGLAAGGGGSGGDRPAISLLVFGEPEELAAYRKLIAAYERREPGARVRLITASDRTDLIARLSTGFAAGSPPDLFLINYRYYGQFASRGALEPLARRLQGSTLAERDFYEPALDAFRWGGTLTCLPQNISSLAVYYNRDLFRRYGVAEPDAGWKWYHMVDRAKALTRDLDGDGVVDLYGLGVEPSIIRLAPLVWSAGGDLVDHPQRPTRFRLDDPAALDAMEALFSLRVVHGVIPSEPEQESEDDETRFLGGRTAMVLSSRRSTPTFRTITDFDWDVAPLPTLGEPAGILHSDAYCMARVSPRKDAAWRFVEFALGAEGQRIVAETGRTVPSLKAVANSPAFLDPSAKPAGSRVFLDAIPTIRRVPSVSTWPEIEDATAGILETAMYDDLPPTTIAREVDRATRELFARGRSR
jgi:multiple sugar transport system substrate-binding protein